jgi:hypothetical protein
LGFISATACTSPLSSGSAASLSPNLVYQRPV